MTMTRALAAFAIAVALPSSAAAAPCPTPAPGETALHAAATALAPGETCEIPVSLGEDELRAAGGGIAVQWTDSGAWDPIARAIHFVGRDAGCGDTSRPFVHLRFDDDLSTWSLEPVPPIPPCGHAYDGNTVDPETGDFFFRDYTDSVAWRWGGGSWTATPEVPGDASSPAIGLAYFPELTIAGTSTPGGLVWSQTDRLFVLPRGASDWTTIALPAPIGDYQSFAEHDPVDHVLVFGGGNSADRVVYRMGADGALTLLGAAPIDLGIHGENGTYVSVDPVSGQFLVYTFGDTRGWWTFDAIADAWAPLEGPPLLSEYAFQVPIARYGVIAMFDQQAHTLFVYRHRASAVPPPADGGPRADAGAASDASLSEELDASTTTDAATRADAGSASRMPDCACDIGNVASAPSSMCFALAAFALLARRRKRLRRSAILDAAARDARFESARGARRHARC
jgi:uncharacterized protein (TIGR03382 family)